MSKSNELFEVSDPRCLDALPRVSVLMITYNHAPYLADAIAGVVKQKCDFPFELIIGEDASSDATREVAFEYQRRHPDLIRVVYSSSNVGMNKNSRRIFERARGEYIAYCEGDDFWCDDEKLAKQMVVMSDDLEIGIVHTDWTKAHLVDDTWHYDYCRSVHRRVANKYLQGNLYQFWHFPKILRTCTILIRKEIMERWYASGIMNEKYPFGDSVLSSWVTSQFKVGYIPAVTAVYRVSPNSALRSGPVARVAFYKASLDFDTAARQFLAGTNYQDGYRWDSAASLIVWGLRARDFAAVKLGLLDFYRHFTLPSFIGTGFKSIAMRLPTWRRQPRQIPENPIDPGS